MVFALNSAYFDLVMLQLCDYTKSTVMKTGLKIYASFKLME